MSRRVCIAVDPSQTSQDALSWAARWVVNRGDEVRLFTVLHPTLECELAAAGGGAPGVASASTAPIFIAQAEASPEELQRGQQFLEACKERVVAEGVPAGRVSGDALVAPAGDSASICGEIVRHAEECGCESLVIGSRGLGLSRKAVASLLGVGSASDHVLNHSHCNVVVYKGKAAA